MLEPRHTGGPTANAPRTRRLRSWALACALVWGCGSEEEPPVTAARAFAAVVPSGDAKRILRLVDERSRGYLEGAAHRASDQVGGRRNIEPHEMVQIVDVDPRFQIAAAELVESDDERARVRLTGVDGSVHELTVVLEDGDWKVSLPLPPPMVIDEP